MRRVDMIYQQLLKNDLAIMRVLYEEFAIEGLETEISATERLLLEMMLGAQGDDTLKPVNKGVDDLHAFPRKD